LQANEIPAFRAEHFERRGRYRGVARVDELARMGLHIGQHVLLVIFRKRIGINGFFRLSAKTDLGAAHEDGRQLHQNARPNCSRDDGLERHCVLVGLAVAGLA
jgi:hypothetical protein